MVVRHANRSLASRARKRPAANKNDKGYPMKIAKFIARFVWSLLLTLNPLQSLLAQTPPDRFEFQKMIQPAVGGWYSPESNFGGITFDINFDANRSVTAGEWQFQENGVAKVVFFQGELQFAAFEGAAETGVIATFESPTFTFLGRSNYVDPSYGGGGTVVLTGRTVRIEFESSRVATFTDNPGQADERRWPIVGALRGLPLVASIDYAGDWVAISRVDFPAAKRTYIGMVRLEAYSGPSDFVIEDASSVLGLTPVGVDRPGVNARIYRMTCPQIDPSEQQHSETPCDTSMDCGVGCLPGPISDLLWVNSNETGALAAATVQSSTAVIYDYGLTDLKVYANNDRILIRGTRDYTLIEMELVRLATGLFPSPADYQCPHPLPPGCTDGYHF